MPLQRGLVVQSRWSCSAVGSTVFIGYLSGGCRVATGEGIAAWSAETRVGGEREEAGQLVGMGERGEELRGSVEFGMAGHGGAGEALADVGQAFVERDRRDAAAIVEACA